MLLSLRYLLFGIVGVVACSRRAETLLDSAAAANRATASETDSVAVSEAAATDLREDVLPAEPRRLPPMEDAEARFERFLSLSLEGAARDLAEFQALFSDAEDCQVYGDSFESYWLASDRVLEVGLSPSEDTVRAAVEVLTAAEQVPSASDPVGSVVIQRVERDTLRFRLVPDRTGTRWQICGIAHDGHMFGSYGHPENTVYQVPGTSRETVLAVIDSLRQSGVKTGEGTRDAP